MTFHDGPDPKKPYTDPAREIPPLSEVEIAWMTALGILIFTGVIVLFALTGCKVIALGGIQ